MGARRAFDRLLAGLFVAAIAAPLVALAVRRGDEGDTSAELRTGAPLPRSPRTLKAALDWPRKFEGWYADHFGLRKPLLRWHNAVRWFPFAGSPTSKFARGAGDWVFYTENGSLDASRGANPMSNERLESWVGMLEARHAWLAERGIRYLYVMAPSKELVYPEHLPAALRPLGPSRFEQLKARMASSGIEFVDLLPTMLAQKAHDGERGPDDLTYYRLGTHWTDRAAYAGYREVVARLAPLVGALPAIAAESFVERVDETDGDSLASQLYLRDLLPQHATKWERGPQHRASYAEFDDQELDAPHTRLADSTLPTALVIHDSFGEPLRNMLSESFSRVTWSWGWAFDQDLIARERPDVVIELWVDRKLVEAPPPLGSARGAAARVRFEAAPTTLVSLAGPALAAALTPHVGTKLEALADGVLLRSAGQRAAVQPKPLDVPDGARVVLHLALEVPERCQLVLFFNTRAEPGFDRARTELVELEPGARDVFVELSDPDFAGRLRLQLNQPGLGWTLRAFEARACEPGS